MYVVQEGEVDIVIRDQVVETVGPGGILGELALIDQGPRSASARARTDCKLVRDRCAAVQIPRAAKPVLRDRGYADHGATACVGWMRASEPGRGAAAPRRPDVTGR